MIYRRLVPSLVVGCIAGLMPVAAANAQAAAKPARIVSINLCTDQILLDLVPRARIKALSILARDPHSSPVIGRAQDFPLVRGSAEEVLAFNPDLILAGGFSSPATVDLLRRLGRRVVVVPLANDMAGIRKTVRQVAAAVGEAARGEAALARFDARLAAIARGIANDGGRNPVAVFYQISSLAAGPGGLADAAMLAAGLRNMARDLRLGPAGRLPLEALVARPPDLIVIGTRNDAYRTTAADNLRHPAFRQLLARRPSVGIDPRLLLCGTPHVADAVETLAGMRASLLARRKP